MSLAALSGTPPVVSMPADGPLLHVAFFALTRQQVATVLDALDTRFFEVTTVWRAPGAEEKAAELKPMLELFQDRLASLVEDEVRQEQRPAA